MVYFKRLITSWSVSLEAFKMYYVMRASVPSLHRESTDSLIHCTGDMVSYRAHNNNYHVVYTWCSSNRIAPGNVSLMKV